MTPDRAKVIFRNRTHRSGVEATPEERQYVSDVQAAMPQRLSWIATLELIANGEPDLKTGEQHVTS